MPPVLTPPDDLTVEATGFRTTVDIGTAAASDESPVTVTSDAPADFPLGTTTVTWTAADSFGNISTARQSIAVTDTTAPQVTAPSNKTVTATAKMTAVTLDEATAADLVDGTVAVTNDAPLLYPVGDTVVAFSARDSSGNVSVSTITVTVLNAAPVLAPPGNQTVKEGKKLEFVLQAADPNEDAVTYSASNLPAGAVFDSAAAKLTWTPGFTQSGTYTVVMGAGDGELEASESVTIVVQDVSLAELVKELIDYIRQHIESSVQQELAVNLLNITEKAKKGGDHAALSMLRAFVNSVEAQRGKKITDGQADILLQLAADIEAVMRQS